MKAINQTFLHPCEFSDMAGKSMEFDNDHENNADINELLAIATLCPYTEGEGVFVARALLAGVYPDTMFVSPCEEGLGYNNKSHEVTDEQQLEDNIMVKIYPNPANDYVTVETDMPLPATMYLYNTMGQKIDEIQIIDAITVLDVSKYKQQLIFYHINGKSGKISLMQ